MLGLLPLVIISSGILFSGQGFAVPTPTLVTLDTPIDRPTCSCTKTIVDQTPMVTMTMNDTSSCSYFGITPTCIKTDPRTVSIDPPTSTEPPLTTTISISVNPPATSNSQSASSNPGTPTPPSTALPVNPSPTIPHTGKRGLAYNNASLTLPFAQSSDSHVTWAYNWDSTSLSMAQTSTLNPSLIFIPMLWCGEPSRNSRWPADVAAAMSSSPPTDALLAYNEPDNCIPRAGGSCIDIAHAVAGYRASMQPFAGQLLLGAPAVTNGPAPMGLAWLAAFLGNCSGCTVDFVPIHWYDAATDVAYFKAYVAEAYAVAGCPLWITEVGPRGSDVEIGAFLREVLPWLDALDYVQRYAYFMDSTAQGGLMSADGGAMSDVGMIYDTFTG